VKDIFAIHRDNYEGTEFDLTKGLAAGPFGDPNRFEGQAESVADKEGKLTPVVGEFERPLNIYQNVTVDEQDGTQCLVLSGGGDLAVHGEMGQIRSDFLLRHVLRVLLANVLPSKSAGPWSKIWPRFLRSCS
jgi:hypothetical protein